MSDCIDSLANYETCEPDEHRARIEFVRMCADVVFNFTGADSVDEAVAWAESLDVEE